MTRYSAILISRLGVLLLLCVVAMAPVSARVYHDLHHAADFSSECWTAKGKRMSAPCTYRSVDQHGDSITLSGKLFLPRKGKAERLILCPHYTITANAECPSECTPFEACLADGRYAMLMPDYQGYGISADRVHPYLDVHLTVQQTLDMLSAAESFLQRVDRLPMNDSIIIVGFSQGAAVAVGALQEMERRKAPVLACYASSGPYDVASLYDIAVERNYIGMAFVVPAFELGTAEAYDISIHPDTIFTSWMVERYPYVLSKEHGVLSTFLHLGRGKLSQYMSAAGMDKSRGEAKLLYEGHLRSSLVHIYGGDTIMSDWCPTTPLYLMHSTNDDLVNYECGANLRTMLERNGATCVTCDFGRYGGHVASLLRFFRVLKRKLK